MIRIVGMAFEMLLLRRQTADVEVSHLSSGEVEPGGMIWSTLLLLTW